MSISAALTAQRQPGDGYEELPPHLCSVAVDAHRSALARLS